MYIQGIPVSTLESIAVGEKNALKNGYKNIFPLSISNGCYEYNLLATVGQAATSIHQCSECAS